MKTLFYSKDQLEKFYQDNHKLYKTNSVRKSWYRSHLSYLKYVWNFDYDRVDRNIVGNFHEWVKENYALIEGRFIGEL